MDAYDKENCYDNNTHNSDAVKGGGLSTSSKNSNRNTTRTSFANRRKWLESGVAGRPNPNAFAATGKQKMGNCLKTGVISERRQWITSQMEKGPMTAAPKGQDIAGSGVIARQRKWVENQMQKGPMTAAPKGQDIAGTGVIERQRKWAEEQMQKGPMTAAPKGQDIAGPGIIQRQKKWVEKQMQKEPMTAFSKGQDIAGIRINQKRRKQTEEQAPQQATALVVPKKDEEVTCVVQQNKDVVEDQARAAPAKPETPVIAASEKKQNVGSARTQAATRHVCKKDRHNFGCADLGRLRHLGTVQSNSSLPSKREISSTRMEPAQKRQRKWVAPKKVLTPKQEDMVSTCKTPADPTTGCYLTYETDSGGRLVLCYQQGGKPPSNAVGFWAPGEGKSIQGFKFSQGCGRSELIKGIAGGDSNRRRYFDGWCQFVKLAKAKNGSVKKFHVPGYGVEVDLYGYVSSESKPVSLNLDAGMVDVSALDAVAVIPRHKDFLQGVKTMNASTFLEKGGIAGSSTILK
eukprot:CAMPEP_0116998728 /NCGR_PEP_ID=MMETSP0472-20121206/1701_1 /TAXON_ID=693140 ORGANISM="Tiarina fusus, Strain LIS" /NCGR_SAMPLE_ID=MMETSP0472 /ASSEMBLY_ACC=CAM_ASM_000603 /LENGTH=515 /DNA_ID=CAMNT_0004697973 /DNA_START=100 /DNA_END=1647 /DNA_ORIENTATION=-